MKKTLLAAVVTLFSLNSFAANKHLICMMGDIADMDIKIESLGDGKEQLSVILMGMDGETKTVYKNSHFVNDSLSKQLNDGKMTAIVSKSDLQDMFGGAFLGAGTVSMDLNKETKAYDVSFSANDVVYQASCK